MEKAIQHSATALNSEQVAQLNELASNMSKQQKLWLSGYLMGVASAQLNQAAEPSQSIFLKQEHTSQVSKFQAIVDVNQKITGRDSVQDFRHIELTTDGVNLHYQTGDIIRVSAGDTNFTSFIASSPCEADDEIHFIDAQGREELSVGSELTVEVEPTGFKLPQANQPIIFIAQAEGVAPARAFMQEIDNTQRSNQVWLLFEGEVFTQDFLYQTEWQDYLKRGVLARMNVAFSKDPHLLTTIYNEISDNADLLWQWLERGAHLYICGKTTETTNQIEQMIAIKLAQQIYINQGGKNKDSELAIFEHLKTHNRYKAQSVNKDHR